MNDKRVWRSPRIPASRVVAATVAVLGMLSSDSGAAAVISTWTFNDTGSGTTEQRLNVALGATSVPAGVTVSRLFVNPAQDFAGFNNVPNTVNDGYGFGGNASQNVIFLHRANYFNNSTTPTPRPVGGQTTWGQPDNAGSPGITTAVSSAPLSFTVSADSQTSVTLNSLLVQGTGQGQNYLVYFQEAGQAAGVSPAASTTSMTVPLNAPVTINAGSSKTFTINLNSGSLDSAHIINTITLDGSVVAVPEPGGFLLLGIGVAAIAWSAARRR